jgi:hypothetical protein
VDSAEIKRGRFKFTADVTGPEFYQVRFPGKEFVGLLVMPGEKISIELGKSPVGNELHSAGLPGI